MNWYYNHPLRNWFFWGTTMLVVVGLIVWWWIPKAELFLFLNRRHTWMGDQFFKYYTHVGDGLFAIMLALIMFAFGKRKLPILILLSFLLSGAIVQIVKKMDPHPRPGLYFEKTTFVHAVDGVLHKGKNSFPSGHTTTAFATASLLALATQRKVYQLLYLAAAILVGYSRIYLGQHFFDDVLAGAFLGTGCSLWFAYVFRNKQWE